MTRFAIDRIVTLSVALPCLLALAACRQAERPVADLIVHNGEVWTVDAARPRAQAIAVAGGRILAVGSDSEVLALRHEETEVIDLAGAFVLPGFNDSHVHFAAAARFLEFNIMAVSTQEELVQRVAEVVERLPAGDWIVGGYWGAYDQWRRGSSGDGGEAATIRFTPRLDLVAEITAEHPMFLTRFDGGEYAVNRAALAAADLDPDAAAPEGVRFARGEDGRFSGILRGPAVAPRFGEIVPPPSHPRRLSQTRRALAEIRRRGVTSVSDMSDDEQLEIYRELHATGELTVRIHFRYPLERWGELAEQGIAVGAGDAWIRRGGLKGHIDGIMGNSTARFFAPYSNDAGNRGRWRRLMVDDEGDFVDGQFLQYLLDADAAGLQLTVHAIGDEANHLLLEYLEELVRRNGRRDRRFRLVHAQVLAEEDFARLGELGVVAEVQPYHLSDDMRWMEERIGAERCRGAYAFRSIAESGAVLSFGSDWPGTAAAEYPIDPMLGLYAATTRQTTSGEPAAGWFPEQRLTIEEAIRAYTLGSAHASFEEHLKGSIEVGKLADLVALDRNLLEIDAADLLATDVLYTIVGGDVVYRRDAGPAS